MSFYHITAPHRACRACHGQTKHSNRLKLCLHERFVGPMYQAVSLTAVDDRQIDNVFTRPSLSQRSSLAPVMGRPQVT